MTTRLQIAFYAHAAPAARAARFAHPNFTGRSSTQTKTKHTTMSCKTCDFKKSGVCLRELSEQQRRKVWASLSRALACLAKPEKQMATHSKKSKRCCPDWVCLSE